MKPSLSTLVATLMIIALGCPAAWADDLFRITAETTDGGTAERVTVSASSVLDLVEEAIESRNEFTPFANRDFEASLDYANVANALSVSVNDSGTEAVLTIPGINFQRTFTGDDRDELEDEIEDFLKEDGADIYAEFRDFLQAQSFVSVLDGNPGATTAILARHSFSRSAFSTEGPGWLTMGALGIGPDEAAARDQRWWFTLQGEGSAISAGEFDGFSAGGELNTGLWLTDAIGVSTSTVLLYQDIEGSQVLHSGFELGLPLRLVSGARLGQEGPSIDWQVTPFGTLGGAGSIDMADGGMLGGGGVGSRLGLDFDTFRVIVGNHLALYEGIPLDVEDYEFENKVSQQVLTNGVLVQAPLGETVFLEGGASYTHLLAEAAIDSWVTPTAALGWRFGDNDVLRLSYFGQFGDDYESQGGMASISIRY